MIMTNKQLLSLAVKNGWFADTDKDQRLQVFQMNEKYDGNIESHIEHFALVIKALNVSQDLETIKREIHRGHNAYCRLLMRCYSNT